MNEAREREARANRAKKSLQKRLGMQDGLVGLGIEEPAPDCLELVAHVTSDDAPVCARIPHAWHGFDVRVVATGTPAKKSPRTRKQRS